MKSCRLQRFLFIGAAVSTVYQRYQFYGFLFRLSPTVYLYSLAKSFVNLNISSNKS